MALGPLVFGRPPAVDGSIVFGEGSDSNVLVRIAATLPGPVVSAQVAILAPVVSVTVDALLPAPSISVLATATNWAQAVVSRVDAEWNEGAAQQAASAAAWRDADALPLWAATLWRDGAPAPYLVALPWSPTQALGAAGGAAWQDGQEVRHQYAQPWQDGATARTRLAQPWQEGQELRRDTRAAWTEGATLVRGVSASYGPGTQRVASVRAPWGWTGVLAHRVREPWRDGENVESHGGGPFPAPVVPPIGIPCYAPDGALVFEFKPATDGSVVFRCDHFAPGPAATTIVPVRKVYQVLDSFQLRRVSDNAVLHAINSATMSLDRNSWTWAMAFTLPLNQLSLVEAAPDGTPVEVEATVNGVAYRMLAEQVARDRQFPSGAVRVSCRGIGGALDLLTGSYSNAGAIRSAAQIMGDILTVNGVGVGWTVDFGLEDWNVEADQWAHTGTAISALQTVAQAAGGYLQPHPTLKTLRVLPSYPVLPWNWGTAIPDIELPSASVLRESISWDEKPRYDRVFVAGQGRGVRCRVTRAGTAGAVLAPPVVDPLIATAVAGRQRGGAILGNTGRQALVSLSLPILAETGIIPPGKLIRYVDGATTRIGLTRSVSVAINRAGSRQTIGIETHA